MSKWQIVTSTNNKSKMISFGLIKHNLLVEGKVPAKRISSKIFFSIFLDIVR